MTRPSVLLVEDNEDLRGILAEILGMAGFELRLASSGREVLAALFTGYRPSCILLDLGLPDMSPEEFFAEFSRVAGVESLPLVLASGNSDIKHWSERFRSSRVLRKPYDLDVLVRVVTEVSASAGAAAPH